MLTRVFSVSSVFCLLVVCVPVAIAQGPSTSQPVISTQPASTSQPSESAISLIRKTVVFIKLVCTDSNQTWDVKGTGFFASYPDARMGENQVFVYLVTNRHVALCWNDSGHPMTVKSITILFNLNVEDGGTFVKEVTLNQSGNVPWVLPEDESVDLAALPMVPNRQIVDVRYVPITLFATKDVLQNNRIHEGDSLFFTGFFYQFPGIKKIVPIVRQGIIAMMPDDKIPFVVTPERLYLADVHAFGGNSGAPAFINLGGFHEGSLTVGQDYRLFGVVNGEMTEDEKFNLELTTTFKGKGAANSGVSTVVPVDDLKALLDGPILKGFRDQAASLRQKTQGQK